MQNKFHAQGYIDKRAGEILAEVKASPMFNSNPKVHTKEIITNIIKSQFEYLKTCMEIGEKDNELSHHRGLRLPYIGQFQFNFRAFRKVSSNRAAALARKANSNVEENLDDVDEVTHYVGE